MILQCAKCSSYAVSKFSRQKYLIRLGISFVLVLYSCFTVWSNLRYDVDTLAAVFGTIVSFVLIVIFTPLSIYYIIKAVTTIHTFYNCGNCKCKLDETQVVKVYGKDADILMNMVRKKKSTN